MKLTLTIHDSRTKSGTASYYSPQVEEYVRTETTLEGPHILVANTLRAIADEIDPPDRSAAKPMSRFAQGGVIR